MRDTSQPASAADGSTSTAAARTNHSVLVGRPSMSMVCLPVIKTMMIENAIITANAARAGADRDHTRRTSAPGRSTDGRPRSRNHCSASARCDASGAAHGGTLSAVTPVDAVV